MTKYNSNQVQLVEAQAEIIHREWWRLCAGARVTPTQQHDFHIAAQMDSSPSVHLPVCILSSSWDHKVTLN